MDQLGTLEGYLVAHDEWRFNRAGLKEIRMVANFSKLHENIHYAEEVCICQRFFSLVHIDILIIQQPLPATQIALHNMLDLLR